MTEDRLYQDNLAAFESRYPEIACELRAVGAPGSQPIHEDGRLVDIDLGGRRLYGMPAAEFARRQVEAYFAAPERVILTSPEGSYLASPVAMAMVDVMIGALRARGIDRLMHQPKDMIGFVLIIGIGLGPHLADVIERTHPRHVILIEPIQDFLVHSLRALDWRALFERCESRGGSLDIVTHTDPKLIVASLHRLGNRHGKALLDGSYLYTHYTTWLTAAVRGAFKSEAMMLIGVRGFFEDEVLMLTNTAGNLIGNEFRLIDGEPRPQRKEPAFVVASGPSMDDLIEPLQRWQSHGVVFSSGSALQILLRHGIIPDYHTELENVPACVDLLAYILEQNKERFPRGRFDGIRLIASTSVDARIPPLFDETYLFFRDSAASTTTLGKDRNCVWMGGPTVANTSLELAATLGFHEMYLFGVDCGRRDDRHHAKDTAYYTAKNFEGASSTMGPGDFTLPGNFGGQVSANFILDWSRRFLEDAILIHRLQVHNLSDGALIQGATPMVAEALGFRDPPLDKAAVVESIRQASPAFAAGEFLRGRDLKRYVTTWDRIRADIEDLLDAARAECDTFEELYERLLPLLDRSQDPYDGLLQMIRSSLTALPTIAHYFLSRIEDPKVRADVLHEFADAYRRQVGEMYERSRALYAAVADGRAPGP
ncbi:MAG: hypothetical protein A3J29_19240 [Acidobacteria bacterium RIFCSPLOWO2_12_FULL_67_14b]|nr:MAG: hypothetical protein A3J29_19240 [Acidobacteria bacterium RIFCSPLOWO2_12_FULL_67_14b]